MRRISLVVAMLAVTQAFAQGRGVPQNGYPDWAERLQLVYTNRARADPAADLAACPYSICAEKDCYNGPPWGGPMPPVNYNYAVSRAARFHSANLRLTGCFSHHSPCALVSDLPSKWDPNTACNGAASCACQGGAATCTASCPSGSTTCTSPGGRIGLFATGYSGENIAYGYPTPREVHYAWFHEPDTNSTCGFRQANGHRVNIVTASHKSLGIGRSNTHYTQDFASTNGPTGTLISGGHEAIASGKGVQFLGTAGNTVEFRVNYYDTRGAPMEAKLNVDGACTDMTLERGGATNATYLSTQTLSGSTCRRYVFSFKDPTGTIVRLPETGSYGVGSSTCPDWQATGPQACGGGGNTGPVILTQASANPSPVNGTTTALSVAAGDDTGEGSLTYTWSQTAGPTGVTFSANGNNGAKSSTATFPVEGGYTLLVTVTDPQSASATSSVNVTVNRTPTTVTVAPSAVTLQPSTTQQFTATVIDQWNRAWLNPPVTWTVSGGGVIGSDGLFQAGPTTGGPFTVKATSGGASGDAFVTISDGPTDTTPPQVFITAPQHGADVSGTVTLAASAIDSGLGVAKVIFYVDDVSVGEDNNSPYSTPWNSDQAVRGARRIRARAVDYAGNAADAEISANVLNGVPPQPDAGAGGGGGGGSGGSDTLAPTVEIITPAQNASLAGITDVEARASDDIRVSLVLLQVDGNTFATLTSEPWRAPLDAATLTPGAHKLTAVARDPSGNQTESQPVAIVVSAGGEGCGCTGAQALTPLITLAAAWLMTPRGRRSRPRASGAAGSVK